MLNFMKNSAVATATLLALAIPAMAEHICFAEKFPEGGSAAMTIKYQNDPGNRYMIIKQSVVKEKKTYYSLASCSKVSDTEVSCVLDCTKDVVTMDFGSQPRFYLDTNGFTMTTNPNAPCGDRDAARVLSSGGMQTVEFFRAEASICN